jgi:uncharacterized phage protein (TIGR02218 family)
MRNASSTLIAALAARTPLWSADLFTLSLPDATVYTWTSADQDIIASGVTYSALGPAIQRSSWETKNTTEIPTMDIQIWSTGTDFGSGNNIKNQIHNGLLDGAYMLLARAFMPEFGNTALGVVILFGGLVGAVEVNSLGAKLTCTASNVDLEQNLPRRTYEATCRNTLYDPQCTLNRASFTDSFTVSAASAIGINWTSAPTTPANYIFGTLTITTGAGAGQAITVNNAGPLGVTVGYPLLVVPAPGDTFTITQGCDKTVARCVSFGNQLNFGGFPYIPAQSSGL